MVQNLWFGKDSSFSPAHLKKAIGKYQPMFSGYNQHDSSELINYLLDGLHEDLNRIKVKPYV
jgi:ubiquitin carboxyl-terminal hydrolase 4/11/15